MKHNDNAMVHLITGATGAGKTTFALALAEQIGGVRFSIDEWMTTLFWMDSPRPIEQQWALDRIARCETMIWAQVEQVTARQIPAILDLGFTKTDHRAAFAHRAQKAGLSAKLHWVDAPADERWQRVEGRNAKQGETFAMQVDRAMFDFMERIWEPPSEAEIEAIAT